MCGRKPECQEETQLDIVVSCFRWTEKGIIKFLYTCRIMLRVIKSFQNYRIPTLSCADYRYMFKGIYLHKYKQMDWATS